MLPITQYFIPAGRNNRPGSTNALEYITIHNTGNTSKGANARAHASFIKSDGAAKQPVSWHYTVDDKEIFQHIPDTEIAWHAGDGGGNGNTASIGIEICMNTNGDLLKATDLAAQLTAELCAKHNIPVENIRQHNHWSGKNCPQMIRSGRPYTWAAFLDKVRTALGQALVPPTAPPSAPTTYRAMVTADSLNIRRGAGTNHAVVGSIRDMGTYTIVQEASGTGAKLWGRLKSGAAEIRGGVDCFGLYGKGVG